MQSYPSSASSPPPMVHEQEYGYTGERDEVQAPKATAPRVVSPVLLMQVWHWLLGFGVAPITSPLCCCTLHSKTNTLQYDNLLPDHEGAWQETTLSKPLSEMRGSFLTQARYKLLKGKLIVPWQRWSWVKIQMTFKAHTILHASCI